MISALRASSVRVPATKVFIRGMANATTLEVSSPVSWLFYVIPMFAVGQSFEQASLRNRSRIMEYHGK